MSDFEAISVNAVGTTVATSTTHNGAAALPVGADGKNPKAIRCMVNSGVVYVKFGGAAVTATTNDCLITSNEHVIFKVSGMAFYDVVADSGTPKLNIVVVET